MFVLTISKCFACISGAPHSKVEINASHFQLLERFTVILYDKTSSLHRIDEAFLPEGEDYGETTTDSKQMSCIPGWNCAL